MKRMAGVLPSVVLQVVLSFITLHVKATDVEIGKFKYLAVVLDFQLQDLYQLAKTHGRSSAG